MSRSSLSLVMTLISVTGKCINLVHRMIISFLIYTPIHDSSKLFEASGLTPAFFVQRPVFFFIILFTLMYMLWILYDEPRTSLPGRHKYPYFLTTRTRDAVPREASI
jgi:hypothetical protein